LKIIQIFIYFKSVIRKCITLVAVADIVADIVTVAVAVAVADTDTIIITK
jgi:hypothetical protein